MRSPRMSSGRRLLLVVGVLLAICSVFVSSLPQWVWSPDAETGPKATVGSGNRLVFGGQIASSEKEKPNIKLEDTQARLFLPSILNAVTGGGRPGNRPITNRPSSMTGGGSDSSPPLTDNSNSGGGGGGGSSSGGQGEGNGGDSGSCNSGTCIGFKATEQSNNAATTVAENNKYDPIRQTTNFRPPLGGISGIFSNFLQSLFGGSASTLPANNAGSGGSSSDSSGSCVCVERSRGCYLPFVRESGGCDSGTRVMCCQSVRGSRIILPSDDDSSSTSTNAVKSVTRSEIRRALLKNIVRGSGSVIDDTLDLILHPFLNKDDQKEVAIRVLSDS